MMHITAALAALLCFALSGCGNDHYRGMYEAVKSRNESTQTPAERSVSPTPAYDSYRKERESQQ